MRKLALMLMIGLLLSFAGGPAAGDTGTYRILSYQVALTPRSDGAVAIQYYQRWSVTGGHIPWITVGTPNEKFTITGSGGAAVDVSSASEGSWSGVRLDLDGDYQPGQTFEVSFSIVQRGLLYAEQSSYKMDFTPGWYDRAEIDTLRVSVSFFAKLETVDAKPQPSSVSGDTIVWERLGLGRGERLSIQVSFPMASFPAGIAKSNLKGAAGEGTSSGKGIVAFIIVTLVILIIVAALMSSKRRYSGGNIFYGGVPGGRIGGGRTGGGRSSGGGGGFGGASMSCACACVSCACACACAGGGGAGCSRKQEHVCPVCKEERRQ